MENRIKKCAADLRSIGAIKEGNFTLKSGQTSSVYVDLRLVISYPHLLSEMGDLLAEKIKGLNCDLIVGVPYTALFFATSLSLKSGLPMIMRRKEKKAYGTQKQIEGNYLSGQKVLIVEDVVTTGSSILETAEDLIQEGLIVKDIVAVLERSATANKLLEARGYRLHSLFDLETL